MSPTAAHPLVDAYRKRLAAAARCLPRQERRDLLEAVEEHLAAGVDEAASESDVRNMLEDLGDPQEIVDAAQPSTAPARRLGSLEVAAVALLLVGAFFPPVVGWVVGVALLWASPAWPVTKKWLGTLVVPGGLAAPVLLAWVGTVAHRLHHRHGATSDRCVPRTARPRAGRGRRGLDCPHVLGRTAARRLARRRGRPRPRWGDRDRRRSPAPSGATSPSEAPLGVHGVSMSEPPV